MAKKQQNTSKSISTKLVYLDLSVVLANYRDPKFWGKQWTIYKSGDIEIYWMMTNINVRENTIQSEVHMRNFQYHSGKYDRQWADRNWYGFFAYCRDVPVSNPEYTQKIFENNIFAATMSLIKMVEDYLIQGYAEYQAAVNLDVEHTDRLKEIAEEIANEYVSAGAYSDEIKEAFIDKYVSDNKTSYASKVMSSFSHKVIGSLYLMICSWFNKKEEFQTNRELMGDNKKDHLWTQMFAKTKEIQTDEWRNAMTEELKASL